MESNTPLESENYFELNDFLKNYLIGLEEEINDLLISKKWLTYLIKKELVIDKTSESKLVNKQGSFQLTTYSLNCIFFSDIEDHFGQRPNDVTLGFVLRISSDNKIQITRDVLSDLEDIEYPNIDFDGLTKEIKSSILDMSRSYKGKIIDFIENRLNE